MMVADSGRAAIQVTSVLNFTQDYAQFGYNAGFGEQRFSPYSQTSANQLTNATAAVSHLYNGQPNVPFMRSDAYGRNATDGLTYLSAESFASSYSDPTSNFGTYAYSSSQGRSAVEFTLTQPSTATLFLRAYAYTDDPGVGGRTQAHAFAELYDYTTGADYFVVADSINGSPLQDFPALTPLTLDAGDYRLAFSSGYINGMSYNPNLYAGGADNGNSAVGIARLFDIQPVASSVSAAPELTSAAAWLGLTVATAIWTRCGNRTPKYNAAATGR
jgi:hypothetical protein